MTETVIIAGTTATIPIGYQPDLSAYPGTGYQQGNQGWDGQQRPRDGNAISGLRWVVDSDSSAYEDDADGMLASSADADQVASDGIPAANGWLVTQPDSGHLTITVPSPFPSYLTSTKVCAYYLDPHPPGDDETPVYYYAVFDVVAAAVATRRRTALWI